MEQILEFAGNHTLLVTAFVVILAALAWNLASDPGGKNSVDPTKATELINHEDAVVVDVRSIAEFGKGHIINAVNIPLNGFKDQLKQLEKHRDKPIVVCCQSGSRSGTAVRILQKEGFAQAKNLRGGMLAWSNANLPVRHKR
jgi:rhodanese-related sulfurtransferase